MREPEADGGGPEIHSEQTQDEQKHCAESSKRVDSSGVGLRPANPPRFRPSPVPFRLPSRADGTCPATAVGPGPAEDAGRLREGAARGHRRPGCLRLGTAGGRPRETAPVLDVSREARRGLACRGARAGRRWFSTFSRARPAAVSRGSRNHRLLRRGLEAACSGRRVAVAAAVRAGRRVLPL